MKTITAREKFVMLNRLLGEYTNRILAKDTLLVRVLGVYMLQSIGNYSVNLMVMENISAGLENPQFKLDLKGCTLDRRQSKDRKCLNSTFILKDEDFLGELESLKLEAEDRHRFIRQIEEDTAMLAAHNIMDYSIFGAFFEAKDPPRNNPYCFRQKQRKGWPLGFYMLGIIDILQEYNASKRCEGFAKRAFLRASARAISTVDPGHYAARLVEFCISVA